MKKILFTHIVACAAFVTANAALLDQLFITDNGMWDLYLANWAGGKAVYGSTYHGQLAEDFDVPSPGAIATGVTADYLTYYGGAEVSTAYWAFYQDAGGKPSETPYADGTVSVTVTNLGYDQIRVSTDPMSVSLAPGTWWVTMQPISDSNYGWTHTDSDFQYGFNLHFRDGPLGESTWGVPTWTDLSIWGYPHSSASYKVDGYVVPEPATLLALGGAALGLALSRKKK